MDDRTGIDREYTGFIDKKGRKLFNGDECRVTRPCICVYGKIKKINGMFWFVEEYYHSMIKLEDLEPNKYTITKEGGR